VGTQLQKSCDIDFVTRQSCRRCSLRRAPAVSASSLLGAHGMADRAVTAPAYSVGMTISEEMQEAILKVPADSWTPAYNGEGQVRDGAWGADIIGMLDLPSWPAGMRVIVRKERPPPRSAAAVHRLRHRREERPLADLELRRRRRARCEDRIRNAKDSALRNHPLKGLRPEPAVVRDHRAGLRTAGLNPDDRLDWASSPLGTQRLRPRLFLRRRPTRPLRPPSPADRAAAFRFWTNSRLTRSTSLRPAGLVPRSPGGRL
jgi:hypothetical protein